MCQHAIGQNEFNKLIEPIVNPSGIWADYNPVLRYYHSLWNLANTGVIDGTCLPPEPNVNDYTNYNSPRSSIWGVAREPYGPLYSTIKREF